MTVSTLGRRAVLAGAAAVAGCAGTVPPIAAVPALDSQRQGFLLFNARISAASAEAFANQVNQLVAINPVGLTVYINSPGGALRPAQDMGALLTRLQGQGISITTHNAGFVASAANFLFLAANRRLSVPQGTFLFHQPSVTGTLTATEIQELSVQYQSVEKGLIDTLLRRTRLNAADAATFVRRTVILSAEEARRDGVIEAVAAIAIANGTPVSAIVNTPARPFPAPTPPTGAASTP